LSLDVPPHIGSLQIAGFPHAVMSALFAGMTAFFVLVGYFKIGQTVVRIVG